MNEKITVRWEVSEQGQVVICPGEVDGMTDDEIEQYCFEKIEDQFSYGIKLHHFDAALARVKEALEDDG